MSLPQDNRKYTYADYITWDGGERWELINGEAFAMAPAPVQAHQEASSGLLVQLANFLKGKPCKVFHAPFDVRLNAENNDDIVVQPDLLVVCDSSKLDGKCCKGAPDLVIEITSPSTARYDRWVKYNIYKDAGVREYWIVEPDTKTVSVNILTGGEYIGRTYGDTVTAPVSVLPGCNIVLADVFSPA